MVGDGREPSVPGFAARSLPFDILLRELQLAHDEEVSWLKAEVATLQVEAEAALSARRPFLRKLDLEPNEHGGRGETEAAKLRAESVPEETDTPRRLGCLEVDIAPSPPGHGNVEPPNATTVETMVQDPLVAMKPGASEQQTIASGTMGAKKSRSAASLRASITLRSERAPPKSWRERLQRFVHSTVFEAATGSAILLNIALIYTTLEVKGREGGMTIRDPMPIAETEALTHLEVASACFTAMFTVELLMKLLASGREYFVIDGSPQWFHIFDFVIVLTSCADTLFMGMIVGSQSTSASNLSLMRAFRGIRLLRILRVARAFSIFAALRLLVTAIFGSMYALFWSMALLSIFMLMAGLFLCQSLLYVIEDGAVPIETREWAYKFYGTSSRACWTAFELTFSGGWPNYARRLVEEVHPGFAIFFYIYVATVVFAMFRIITALFLKDTLRVAALDVDNTINEKIKEKQNYQDKLANFFHAADTSGDGMVSLEEFDDVIADDRVKAYFSALELDPMKTRGIFMDGDGDGSISIDEFVACAMKMKGVAKAQDIVSIMDKLAKLEDAVTADRVPKGQNL